MASKSIKRAATIFLQLAIVILGVCVLAALLWEPTVEGVNAHATTLYQIYFDDPFLAYIYFSFVAVFVGLYQAFKLLGYIGRNEAHSQQSVQALRTIKHCAFAFAGFIFAAVAYIFIVVRGTDDIAGGVALGLFMIIASLVIATAAAMFERILGKRIQTP
jgi:Protein of unknown function (DUF2975)